MNRSVSTILAFLLPALLVPTFRAPGVLAAPRSNGAEEAPAGEEPAPDPSKVSSALERVKTAPGEERRRAVKALIALGPAALAEARRARDEAADPEVKAALGVAARWLLAAKLRPVLARRYATNLTFDGQYDDLKAEGPEAPAALLSLFDDEETVPGIRISAARALADLRDPGILPAVRRIEDDPLLAFRLREEAATLMAILGDTSRMDRKIQELLPEAEKKLDPLGKKSSDLEALGDLLTPHYKKARANIDLSNLYYRIRQYKNAIICYDRAIEIWEDLRPWKRFIPQFDEELALSYYNAACSLSLNGETERAKEMIRKSVELDPLHLKNIDKDGDLRNLRQSPGYADFKRELEKPLQKKSI